jgi:hypothetical protein
VRNCQITLLIKKVKVRQKDVVSCFDEGWVVTAAEIHAFYCFDQKSVIAPEKVLNIIRNKGPLCWCLKWIRAKYFPRGIEVAFTLVVHRDAADAINIVRFKRECTFLHGARIRESS